MTRALILALALLSAGQARAQVAYAVAPEQASAFSFAMTVEEAMTFALEECVYMGVEIGYPYEEMVENCQIASVCAYGDWAIMVSAGSEIHWAEFYCGLPNEAAARGLAELVCNLYERPHLSYCDLVQIYDRGRHVLDAD